MIGTDAGGLMLWETHTGRTIRTPEAHLGPVTALRIDPAENFALSAGEDGAVLVWSIPALLAFGNAGTEWSEWRRAPVRSLRAHRDAIVDVKIGHTTGARNIAVSASKDASVVVWDYHEGMQLRTILLPQPPTCLTLDPCDRAVLCGYGDGSVVCVDFLALDGEKTGIQNPIWDESKQALVVQVGLEAKWKPPAEDLGAVLCAAPSYDGTKLVTGHESGNIIVWDIPTGRYGSHLTSTQLPGPVSNLEMLEVTGFAGKLTSKVSIREVVKPRFGELDTNDGVMPDNYKFTTRLVGNLPFTHFSAAQAYTEDSRSAIDEALCHPSFPEDMLADSIADLHSVRRAGSAQTPINGSNEKDFMALDGDTKMEREGTLERENEELIKQIEALKRLQKQSFAQLEKMASMRQEAMADDKRAQKDIEALVAAERSWEVDVSKRKSKRP